MARVGRLDRASYVVDNAGIQFKVLAAHGMWLWLQEGGGITPITVQAESYQKYVPSPKKDQIWVDVNNPEREVKVLATPNDSDTNLELVTFKTTDGRQYDTVTSNDFTAFYRPVV